MTKLGVKIKNCVRIKEGYYAIDNNEKFDIGGIKVQSIPTPGHTLGGIPVILLMIRFCLPEIVLQ